MSNFQQKFVRVAEQAYNTSKTLISRYRDDSIHAVEILCDEISELQHAKTYLSELSDCNRLQLYFKGLENRFNTELKKHTKQFTEEVTETYMSYDKKLKSLFVEEGVSQKNIYDYIDRNSEDDYSSFFAKVDNIRVDTNIFRETQLEISQKAGKILSKANFKKRLLLIIPAFLSIVIIVASLIVFIGINNAEDSSDIEATFSIPIIESEIVLTIPIFIQTVQHLSRIVLYTLFMLVFIWVICYIILRGSVKRKMISRLEQIMEDIYAKFSVRRQELQDSYAMWLEAHLGEMNKKYFIKYKPLIEIIQNQKGRINNGTYE
jgi:hypothetical protein